LKYCIVIHVITWFLPATKHEPYLYFLLHYRGSVPSGTQHSLHLPIICIGNWTTFTTTILSTSQAWRGVITLNETNTLVTLPLSQTVTVCTMICICLVLFVIFYSGRDTVLRVACCIRLPLNSIQLWCVGMHRVYSTRCQLATWTELHTTNLGKGNWPDGWHY